NSYTGPTTVQGGMISLGSDNSLPPVPTSVGPGAAIDMNGHSLGLGSLSGTALGDGQIQNSGAVAKTLTTGQDNSTMMFSGEINGLTNLVKMVVGEFPLAGLPKQYTGSTEVQSGKLSQGSDNVLPPLQTLVDQGGTMDMGGFGASLGSLVGAGQ